MPSSQFIRVGKMGSVGRFRPVDSTIYPRRSRVVIRTSRGLETGDVLSPPVVEIAKVCDGQIIRAMTVEDELLQARLEQAQKSAFEACSQKLRQLHFGVNLLDVEHLFDGNTLVFYFLGNVPEEAETVTAKLAAVYNAQAQFQKFADTLEAGCGPGCGTDQAQGGGCTSCGSGCAVASLCNH